ncbi:zinc ABC transporter permease [Skermanella stibiiresistens SB22]|uniref:Zinc ABC transporter permease n=1 Tax=Skermanella stibiiresistens SB22 TaxID=1385369 RepID=W9HCT9_9PROT|nr:metal ABC transporter permease [Skermanella stibiiresistens]EWY42551.1 zinc ABC transporter permease [Skermanella stibiiresistens SB22]
MITTQEFLQIDLPAMTAAVLACVCCALVGNFLVLRRQSLLGDAISHAILPGIVAGFLITGTRAGLPVILGALAAAVIAGVLIEAVRRFGRLDGGAAMGVVFTVMFAGGVVLIEQGAARAVDLDADCVLYGQLEAILWLAPQTWADLADPAVWADLPRQVVTLALVTLLCVVCVVAFAKELAITSFDPALATTLGIPAGLFHHAVVVLVAIAAIASFEAVGSILVVAMLICPAATARLLTDRLPVQLWLSVAIGGLTGAGGYLLGAFGPSILAGGPADALNAAGMIATLAGVLLTAAILFAPRHGVLARNRPRHRGAAGHQMGKDVVSDAVTH